MQRSATNYSTGDSATASKMNEALLDLDTLFETGFSEDLDITWDLTNERITTMTDTENSVTYTFDWSMFGDATTPYFDVTDGTSTWRFSYSAANNFFTGVVKL